jgi:hypothetical protein
MERNKKWNNKKEEFHYGKKHSGVSQDDSSDVDRYDEFHYEFKTAGLKGYKSEKSGFDRFHYGFSLKNIKRNPPIQRS